MASVTWSRTSRGSTLYLSGTTPPANPLADAQAWPALLAFLADLG